MRKLLFRNIFLKPHQRIILSITAKNTIVHRHPYKFITAVLGLLTVIALYIPFFSGNSVPTYNQSNQIAYPTKRQEPDTLKDKDSLKYFEIDSLQQKEKLK